MFKDVLNVPRQSVSYFPLVSILFSFEFVLPVSLLVDIAR